MKSLAILGVMLTILASPLIAENKQPCSPVDDPNWMGKALLEIKTVQVGMTRADLLKVFAPSAGFGSGNKFQYRKLPYIMVEVEFAPEGDKGDHAERPPTS